MSWLHLKAMDTIAFCEEVGTSDMGILWVVLVPVYLLARLVEVATR